MLAKLQSPVVDNVVFRKRLFLALEQARKKSAIWVTGQPGSGKTTLVASYISAYKIPHAWYHIDSSDMDLATFFYYLKLLVKRINGKKSTRLPALTPEYLPNISIFAQRYFENLYTMLPKGFVLVFDNYHEVNANPLFHTIMHEALMRVPGHGNVILISRTEPPDLFSSLEANSMMEIVGNEMIKFTPGETQELIKLRSGNGHNKEMVNRLHDWTDGWAAGIILMLERNKEKLDSASQEDFKDNQAIFDYFSAEIFEKMKSADQDFLLKTCLFPTMTAEMATQMSGNRASKKLLGDLIKSHYFTIKSENGTYAYHDLFREFLISKTKDAWSDETIRQNQQRAGEICENSGYIEDATALFLQSGRWNDAVSSIIRNAHPLVLQGRYLSLETWLKELPVHIIKSNPRLIYWQGRCRLPFNPIESYPIFEEAFKHFKKNGEKKGLFMAWAGIMNSVTYRFGDYKLYDRWIRIMEKFTDKKTAFPSQEIDSVVSLNMFIAMVFRQTFKPGINKWLRRVTALLEKTEDMNLRVQLSTFISLYYLFIGEVTKAGVIIERIKGLDFSHEISPLVFITFKDLEVLYCLYTAEYSRYLKPFSEAKNIINTMGVHVLDNTLYGNAALLALSSGNLPLAQELLKEISMTIKHAGAFDASRYYMVLTWEAMLRNDFSSAIISQKTGLKLSLESGSLPRVVLSYIQMAQVLHELKEDREALLYLGKAHKISKGSDLLEFMSLLIKAQISFGQNNQRSGLRFLRRGMDLGQSRAYINFHGWRPSVMARLGVSALDAGITPEYVKSLIRQRNLFPDTPPYTCENWPWALKIYTLGSFKILHEDAPIELSRKAQVKPIELLQFLVVNHDKAVELDHISGMLWPDAQGDYAHQTLDTTIHRLRKLLGSNDAVIAEGGRLMLNPKTCWVDVQAFGALFESEEELLHGSDTSIKLSDRDSKVRELGRRILNLYKGDFFAQGALPSWAISFRDSLHDRFTHVIEMLGDYYEKSGDTVQAVRIYKKGLEIDNQAELFYQRLMLLYQSHGRTAEAVTVYQQCSTILSRTLGIEPSGKTEEIYRGIVKSAT